MGKQLLIREVIELQRTIDRARRQDELDVWMELNVTLPQLKSLFFIGSEGTTNLSSLASTLNVTPTNVTGIVDRLVKQGLITRTENPDDRRMLLLRVTKEGEELINRLRERRLGYLNAILKRISLEELETLSFGLKSIIRAIEAEKNEKGA